MTITNLIRIAKLIREVESINTQSRVYTVRPLEASERDDVINTISHELTAAGVTHTLDQVCEVLGVKSK